MPAPTTATSWVPVAPFARWPSRKRTRAVPCSPHADPRHRCQRLRRRRADPRAWPAEGHELRAFARTPARVPEPSRRCRGRRRATRSTGAGLDEALEGVDVAYYLIHSMETVAARARRGLRRARPARGRAPSPRRPRAPACGASSTSAAWSPPGRRRLAAPGQPPGGRGDRCSTARPRSVALRASIVIGARSRSFRFLVRLVERVPVMPLPPWRDNRTQPIDGRDVLAYLVARGDLARPPAGRLARHRRTRRRHLRRADRPHPRPHARRPRRRCACRSAMTPVASRVAAAIAGEDPGSIGPLMGSLAGDLLPRDDRAARAVRRAPAPLRPAVERALREWEAARSWRPRGGSAWPPHERGRRTTIHIDGPPQEVWDLVMDAERTPRVGDHRARACRATRGGDLRRASRWSRSCACAG